ncbi:hypothetical protein GJ698_12330 [Pseudoduganella sp. FT26W]|uniref:Uncharacterized protein n=1 Tax=Duganella aquatilis TaxID=2666082 RepID=A0A844DBL8_9BURK|nr:hypothetical protein [Duganella aquatilis]MRW84869.1 hypothetical protein [Duganella aquatilis]
MMQTEHDDNNFDVRTIFLKTSTGVTHKKEIKKKGSWLWDGLKKLNVFSSDAIAYLTRDKNGNLELKQKKGTLISKSELTAAILEHFGINQQKIDPNVWHDLPPQVAAEIGLKLKETCEIAQDQATTSSEGKLCGTIFAVPKIKKVGSWEIKFSNVEFSSVAKEDSCGADIAVLLHATDASGRTAIKTLWFQAKKDVKGNTKPDDLARLKEQFTMMRAITDYSYPLIITTKKIYVLDDYTNGKKIDFNDFMTDAVTCKYGDQRETVYADSLDRKAIFEIAIKKIVKPKKPKTSTNTSPGASASP